MADRKRIYLAGKCKMNDWRWSLVKGINKAKWTDDEWPTLEKAVYGCFDYVGPYPHLGTIKTAYQPNASFDALGKADYIFAWIDDLNVHTTLVELGLAYEWEAGPEIIIAGPQTFPELWFAYHVAHWALLDETDPISAFQAVAISSEWSQFRIESPIEQMFWDEWERQLPATIKNDAADMPVKLEPQHEVWGGKYRLDFAHLPSKTAIELDSFQHHDNAKQFARDVKRQRDLECEGWGFIRFGGSELHKDVSVCVRETIRFISQRWNIDIRPIEECCGLSTD